MFHMCCIDVALHIRN